MTALLSKAAAPFVIAGLLFVAGFGLWAFAASQTNRLAERVRAEARAERDSHWTAEIERANAHAARRIADQAREALRVESVTNERIRAAEQKQVELEKKNAALPNGDRCGLDRDRVRLLPR
ncbi:MULTISPECIES: hypothetical protein [unclassified Ensifer]|uniref:hypothetical protein n=1 Tax=unclassified Ensifer TaxID=2633371 RepID=UPI00081337FF|nr:MULTISPECIES: hypothetical protein [unclassified Ensifer]OCP17452.1 hypothetical protein BC361_08320 [Ensifer sp. LC54]OCP28642.1 hypothetical protein BC363_02035 [Ensifer sp. LC384]